MKKLTVKLERDLEMLPLQLTEIKCLISVSKTNKITKLTENIRKPKIKTINKYYTSKTKLTLDLIGLMPYLLSSFRP